jgi:hypothetical protein
LLISLFLYLVYFYEAWQLIKLQQVDWSIIPSQFITILTLTVIVTIASSFDVKAVAMGIEAGFPYDKYVLCHFLYTTAVIIYYQFLITIISHYNVPCIVCITL